MSSQTFTYTAADEREPGRGLGAAVDRRRRRRRRRSLGAPHLVHFYRTLRTPVTPGELADLSAGWRPFRPWASVLLRVSRRPLRPRRST